MIARSWLTLGLLALPIAFAPGAVRGQSPHAGHHPGSMPPAASPYRGQERQSIKALAPGEIEQLLRGEGMGLAKAAELNHYPGPRHVLDAAEQLGLSPAQREAGQTVFAAMQARALPLGAELLERERELDAAFAAGTMTDDALSRMVAQIARLHGELRTVHLRAHLEMRRILTSTQIRAYDQLRGYAAASEPPAL